MLTRRRFLSAAVALSAAPGVAQMSAPTKVAVHPPGPYWFRPVPNITFTQGIAARISVAGYVTDAQSIAYAGASLPLGVSYNAATFEFVYDGKGAIGSTQGNVLMADDGKP